MHVDDFIDDFRQDPYARWLMHHWRLSADLMLAFRPFMKEHRLYCSYDHEVYRCFGASSLGDVWLTKDFDCDVDADIPTRIRVDVAECCGWAPTESGVLLRLGYDFHQTIVEK